MPVAVTALSAVLALVVLGVLAALRPPADLSARLRRLGVGTAMALGVSVPLLAYPVWMTFAGPAHLTGLVWPNAEPGYFGVTLEGSNMQRRHTIVRGLVHIGPVL